MNSAIGLILTCSLILIFVYLAYYVLNKLTKSPQRGQHSSQNPTASATSHSSNDNSTRRQPPTNSRTEASAIQAHLTESRSSPPVEDSNQTNVDPNKKYTKKEQHKMLKKKEKEEQREYQKQFQELKKLKEQEKEKEMLIKEQKKEEEKRKLEEMLQKIKEEEEKKENEIYDQWKDKIQIGEEGELRSDFDNEDIVNSFINYIKLRKVVSLEDLSGEFKIPPDEIAERLGMLEEQGKIQGIIDDRGKYIYLTEKELSVIEKLFITRGRISKADLIKECNRIIRFTPSEEDKAKILEEQSQMLKRLEEEIK